MFTWVLGFWPISEYPLVGGRHQGWDWPRANVRLSLRAGLDELPGKKANDRKLPLKPRFLVKARYHLALKTSHLQRGFGFGFKKSTKSIGGFRVEFRGLDGFGLGVAPKNSNKSWFFRGFGWILVLGGVWFLPFFTNGFYTPLPGLPWHQGRRAEDVSRLGRSRWKRKKGLEELEKTKAQRGLSSFWMFFGCFWGLHFLPNSVKVEGVLGWWEEEAGIKMIESV